MTTPSKRPISAVDFTDPMHRNAVMQLGTDRKCSYLMALAAWQRGLTVEFFGSMADARVKIANMIGQSAVPELFSITDGRRSHFFHHSMGDATTPKIADLARKKTVTKKHFLRAGVRTPAHVVWNGLNIAEVQGFLAQLPGKSFVIKPDIGSLRSGVQVRVPAAQVIPRLSAIGPRATLVEEQIEGLEHRVYVVGGQVIAGHVKPGVTVTGNGRDTIAQLIHRKNALRLADPPLATYLIDLAAAVQHLAASGQSATRVPVLGERVVLSHSNNMADGGDGFPVTDRLEPDVERMAIGACASIGLPNGAVDLIFDGQHAHALEVNDRAALTGHSFVTGGEGCGNAVAEAIVDWYFPLPDGAVPQRHSLPLDCSDLVATFARHGTKARFRIAPLPAMT